MAIESPLFQSALELVGHSYSHFNSSEELDRKLVILHLANSIELIFKDIVLDLGESIYKNPKETISIHGCLETLNKHKIIIPYLNKIELLIDERNALQHRFGSPNELTTIFYMNIALAFYREILKLHYDKDYDEVIQQYADEKELAAYRMREPKNSSELENLKKLANLHSLGALLSAMTYLEKLTLTFGQTIGLADELRGRPPWHMISPRFLERFGIIIPVELGRKLDEARRLRNSAAHARNEPTKEEVTKAIDTIESFEKFISEIDIDSIKISVQTFLTELNLERQERR